MAVEFNEERILYGRQTQKPKGFSPIRLVQKWGLASDDRSASFVLLSLIVVCVAIVVFILFSGRNDSLSSEDKAKLEKVEMQLKARNGI